MKEVRRRMAPASPRRAVGAVCVLMLLSACGSRTEYLASELSLDRVGWDSVAVDVSFARRQVIGGTSPLQPDTVIVTLFDAAYESLYYGSRGMIPIPDRRLGDRERLAVEVCGRVRARHICVQGALEASPKRLHVDEEIIFPDGTDLSEGSFDFSFGVERQTYDGDGWEPISAEGVNGHLLVWVDHHEAREQGVVHVPFTRSRGRFDLSRYANYKNFKYFLDSELLDQETAEVHFDVYAGLNNASSHVASVRKEVHRKTEGERADDVRYFVEQATRLLIDELGSFLGSRRVVAYVEDWRFNQLSGTYVISMEFEWDGPIFDRGHYELEGELQVREDGTQAWFEMQGGNRRGVRRWRRRADDHALQLGNLEPPPRSSGRTASL